MAEYSELETLKANGRDGDNTIRTHFAEIIVRGTADKPYYEILYFDTEDGSYHIGFGSYYLEYVFKWLSEEFEIVADWQTADIDPVRHGRWLDQIGIKKCSLCRVHRETCGNQTNAVSAKNQADEDDFYRSAAAKKLEAKWNRRIEKTEGAK